MASGMALEPLSAATRGAGAQSALGSVPVLAQESAPLLGSLLAPALALESASA
jgi:hypothetical protein